jgi:hypothetical protein
MGTWSESQGSSSTARLGDGAVAIPNRPPPTWWYSMDNGKRLDHPFLSPSSQGRRHQLPSLD